MYFITIGFCFAISFNATLWKYIKQKNAQASLAFFCLMYLFVGRAGFEPAKFSQQIYSLPSLAAWVSPHFYWFFSAVKEQIPNYFGKYYLEPAEGLEPTTCWLQISCSSQLSYAGKINKKSPLFLTDCKCISFCLLNQTEN